MQNISVNHKELLWLFSVLRKRSVICNFTFSVSRNGSCFIFRCVWVHLQWDGSCLTSVFLKEFPFKVVNKTFYCIKYLQWNSFHPMCLRERNLNFLIEHLGWQVGECIICNFFVLEVNCSFMQDQTHRNKKINKCNYRKINKISFDKTNTIHY